MTDYAQIGSGLDATGVSFGAGSIVGGLLDSIGGLFGTGGLFGPGGDDPTTFKAYLNNLNGTGYWGNKLSAYYSLHDNSVRSLTNNIPTLKSEFVDINAYELSNKTYTASKTNAKTDIPPSKFPAYINLLDTLISNEKSGIVNNLATLDSNAGILGTNLVSAGTDAISGVSGIVAQLTSSTVMTLALIGLFVYLFYKE